MKKILFTHATTQNFQFVINLLKNLETYGHEFKFIKLKKQGSKTAQIFPKWANLAPLAGLFVGASALGGLVFFFWYYGSPKYTDVGYQPDQPINYSHKFHVQELGLDCRYCHSFVEFSSEANVPSTNTCMNCHNNIEKESEDLDVLIASFNEDIPIEWVKVHMLPDFTYFDHSVHLNADIGCVSCHGRVDQMDVVRQVEPLSMSWCLECHREPEKFLRPVEHVTTMDWHPDVDQLELGKILKEENDVHPKEYCSTCHR